MVPANLELHRASTKCNDKYFDHLVYIFFVRYDRVDGYDDTSKDFLSAR